MLLADARCQPWLGLGGFRERCRVQEADFALKHSAEGCKAPFKVDTNICRSCRGFLLPQVVMHGQK